MDARPRDGTPFVTGHPVWSGVVICSGMVDPAIGFGGTMSGYGWKGSMEHVESFLYRQAVYMNLAS